jgi:ketosteroid isomerase-like protein
VAASIPTRKERRMPQDTAVDVDELRSLFTEWLEAIPRHDVEVIKRLLDPDWIYTDYTGHTHDRTEYFEIVGDLVGDSHETELVDFEARMAGADIAIATGRYRVQGTFTNGVVNSQDSRFTSVWRHDRSDWRCLAHQATNIGEPFM